MSLEYAIAKGIEWDRAAAMVRRERWIIEKEAEVLKAKLAAAEERAEKAEERYAAECAGSMSRIQRTVQLERELAAAIMRSNDREKEVVEASLAMDDLMLQEKADMMILSDTEEAEAAWNRWVFAVEALRKDKLNDIS